MAETITRMNIREMINLCYSLYDVENAQIRIMAHEVFEEYEYIDFVDIMLHPDFRQPHRIRKIMGVWQLVY